MNLLGRERRVILEGSADVGQGGELRQFSFRLSTASRRTPFETTVLGAVQGDELVRYALLDEKVSPSVVEDTLGFILKSGRALIFPIYKSTYERRDDYKLGSEPPRRRRDQTILWSKDVGRTLNYLETRTDIDSTKIAYFGFSAGGHRGPIFLAARNGSRPRSCARDASGSRNIPRRRTPSTLRRGRKSPY